MSDDYALMSDEGAAPTGRKPEGYANYKFNSDQTAGEDTIDYIYVEETTDYNPIESCIENALSFASLSFWYSDYWKLTSKTLGSKKLEFQKK